MAQQDPVQTLKSWFDNLPRGDKEQVLTFVYGPTLQRVELQEGVFLGPSPSVLGGSWEKKGLFLGPVPTQSARVCPTCQRPY